MSVVISFRLNPENRREVLALQVLERRVAEGYSIRQFITEALIHFEGTTYEQDGKIDELDLKTTLVEILKLLHQWQRVNNINVEPGLQYILNEDLTDSFVSSVRISVKPGLIDL